MKPGHLLKTVVVNASPEQVWEAWTTEAGARTFLAPHATIDLEAYGRYEMLFDLEAPEGMRGGEDCKVLGFQPGRMLSFTWNAPPHLDAVRQLKTCVVVDLAAQGAGFTEVTLTHVGWGEGGQWDEARAYFESAWGLVLQRLERSFREGPLDWSAP